MASAQKLAHIVNLNTLLLGPPPAFKPTPLAWKIARVAAAPFDGFSAVLTPEHRRLADRHGIELVLGVVVSSDPEEFAAKIRSQKEAGAVQINVQLDEHDTPPAAAVRHWLRFVREAEKIGGVEVSLETHRDCCTETPEKTYEIAERYFKATGELIRLTFDLSHFAIIKSLQPEDYSSRLLDHPDLIRNANICHFRPFNGHHCEIPVKYRGQLTREAVSYLAFARDLMRMWRTAPRNRSRTLYAVPEMLPRRPNGAGYNITGFPLPWRSALDVRAEIAKAWRQSVPA